MKKKLCLLGISLMLFCGNMLAQNSPTAEPEHYTADKETLDKHPVAPWWNESKFGIMLHHGVYSVPAYNDTAATKLNPFFGYAVWYPYYMDRSPFHYRLRKHHKETYGKDFVYDDFIPMWKPDKYDAKEIVDLVVASGAKYFAYPAKHHDGICNWDTKTTGRNTVDMNPHRDFLKETWIEAEKTDLINGLYFTVPEWYNPATPKAMMSKPSKSKEVTFVSRQMGYAAFSYKHKPRNAFTKEPVPYTGQSDTIKDFASQILKPQLYELMNEYKPSFWYLDIGGNEQYLKMNQWMADYYNFAKIHNPEGVMVNDRASDIDAHHDWNTTEFHSGVPLLPFDKVDQVQRCCVAYSEQDPVWKDGTGIVKILLDQVELGGNLTLMWAPKKDGSIAQQVKDALIPTGKWLKIYGDGVYGSTIMDGFNTKIKDEEYYTKAKDGSIYVFYPKNQSSVIIRQKINFGPNTKIELVGKNKTLTAKKVDGGYQIDVPAELVDRKTEVNYGAIRIVQ